MQLSISFVQEPLAKVSQLQDFEKGWLTHVVTLRSPILQSLNNIAPVGWFGRTFPVFCQNKAGRLEPSSEVWENSGMGSPTE
jgi:hypothetical protein